MSQKTIGRYEIVEELGRGGMATVYRAYDPTLEREVALKLLPNYFAHDPEFSARFEREAKTVASLEHNAIVSMYDYGEDGEWPYFVMRLMQGGSLKDRISRGPLELKEATKIIQRIAGALDKAHSRGIVHRDLKPGNIMFDEDGEAYLGDFGIVKLAEGSESYTRTGNTLGTPAYMSPEQADGRPDIDGRSDVYALGIILYEMLVGSAPYVHDSMPRLLVMHLTAPIPNMLEARPDLPAALQTVIEKAMAKERDDRFATAGELAAAALSAADGAAAMGQLEEKAVSETETHREEAELPPEPQVEAAEPPTRAAETIGEQEAKVELPAEAVEAATPVTAAPSAPLTPTPEATVTAPEKPAVAKKGFPKWVFGIGAVIVIGVIAVIVLGGGDGVSGPAEEVQESELSFVNLSDSPACHIFISPSGSSDWGVDFLGDTILDLDDDIQYSVDPGSYDILVENCDEDTLLEEYGIDLEPGDYLELELP